MWQKSLGGSGWDEAYSIQQTFDGGYIVAGISQSNDGNVTGNHGNEDYWVVKLDANGNIVWQKSLGGSRYDWAYSIQQTFNGGYIVAGYSSSTDGNVTGNHGHSTWVVKLDASGNIVWQKCFLDSSGAYSIQQTSDSGYIVAGYVHDNYSLTKISPDALVSNFSGIPVSRLASLKVGFTDQSVGSPTSWSWDFGDGNTSSERNPVHIYSVTGNYTVNLTVSNEKYTDIKSAIITVLELPVFPDYTNPPKDLDHDGYYEDLNGNGILDFDDFIVYYNNMDWIEENSPVALFDYNKNDLIDFNDVVRLYNML